MSDQASNIGRWHDPGCRELPLTAHGAFVMRDDEGLLCIHDNHLTMSMDEGGSWT